MVRSNVPGQVGRILAAGSTDSSRGIDLAAGAAGRSLHSSGLCRNGEEGELASDGVGAMVGLGRLTLDR